MRAWSRGWRKSLTSTGPTACRRSQEKDAGDGGGEKSAEAFGGRRAESESRDRGVGWLDAA